MLGPWRVLRGGADARKCLRWDSSPQSGAFLQPVGAVSAADAVVIRCCRRAVQGMGLSVNLISMLTGALTLNCAKGDEQTSWLADAKSTAETLTHWSIRRSWPT